MSLTLVARSRRDLARPHPWAGLATLRTILADGVAAERQRLALWLPVGIGAGVLLYFALPREPPLWTGPLALAAAIAATAASWRWLLPRVLALALAAAALGACAGQLATLRALPSAVLPSRAVIVTGTVRGLELLPQGRRVTLAEPVLGEAAPLARTLRIRLRAKDATEFAAGDTIRVRALVRAPEPPSYPGARDLQRDAWFSGTAGSGFALGPVQRLAQAPPSGLARWWQALRDTIAARILAGLPGPDGAIAATLLTGTSSAIPEPDRAAFRDSGLAHLLAVAGLHIGIVMGLVMGATRFALALWERAALRWPIRQVAALTALTAGGLYMLLTGMHLPILRSFAMAGLATLGLLLGRRAVSLRALALAASVLLLASPQEVLGVSFQMSFSAVLALIAGYEGLRPRLARLYGDGSLVRRTGLHLAGLALTSLLAGTASAPFAAAAFGHVQLYFVAANMLAVPVTALWVMPCGLAALGLMPLGLERLALLPMGWGIAVILWTGRTVSAWPAAIVAVPPIPGWGLLLVASGMAAMGLLRVRARWLGAVPVVLGLGSPLLAHRPDLLVSADARLIGLRDHGQVFLQSHSGASRYVREDWLTLWAAASFQPMPADGATGDLACDDAGCTMARDGARVLVLRPGATTAACPGLSLLVSPEPAQGLCPGVPRIDRFTVWREGAQAVRIEGGMAVVVSDRASQGERPWSPPAPGGRAITLPAAATDQGG